MVITGGLKIANLLTLKNMIFFLDKVQLIIYHRHITKYQSLIESGGGTGPMKPGNLTVSRC